MSDCMGGGRFTHRWSDQVWHTPTGRTIHAPEGDELCEAVAYRDGKPMWTHPYVGPIPDYFEANGQRYVKPPFRDYDCQEVD